MVTLQPHPRGEEATILYTIVYVFANCVPSLTKLCVRAVFPTVLSPTWEITLPDHKREIKSLIDLKRVKLVILYHDG